MNAIVHVHQCFPPQNEPGMLTGCLSLNWTKHDRLMLGLDGLANKLEDTQCQQPNRSEGSFSLPKGQQCLAHSTIVGNMLPSNATGLPAHLGHCQC